MQKEGAISKHHAPRPAPAGALATSNPGTKTGISKRLCRQPKQKENEMNAQTLPARTDPTAPATQEASGLLSLPPHFDPTRAGKVWKVDYLKLMADATGWYRTH